MNPTKEQVAINQLVAERNDVIISAGAGTGKSSTLRYVASQNPKQNFLVLCFNAANAKESNEHPDRTSNIFYSTIHSIAYREVVDSNMRKKLQPYLNYKDISEEVLLKEGLCEGAMDAKDEKRILVRLRRGIQDCITYYCRSDSSNLTEYAESCYSYWFKDESLVEEDEDVGSIKTESVMLTEDQQISLAKITRKYWLTMIDAGSSYSITHDVYLKLYQLRNNKIAYYYDKDTKNDIQLDCLMLDEAQDTNPVAQAIFDNSSLQKVIVGDRWQQLYAWRGAGNAMESYKSYESAKLSTSFRFNPAIAHMANTVLNIAGAGMHLEGASIRREIVTKAHLCRTNLSVIKRIFAEIEYNSNVVINTNINLKELFSKMYHINSVSFGEVPKFPNKQLKDIMTREALDEAMEMSDDLKSLVKLSSAIAKSANGLTAGINKIKDHITDKGNGHLTISTIHKSKGLEWDEVVIDDDLVRITRDSEGYPVNLEQDLADFWESTTLNCLTYVAITRAKVKCTVPEILAEYFE